MAATFSSTGTPAVFLHPVEAMHGDIGLAQKNDIGLLFSNSGESQEVLDVLQAFKRWGCAASPLPAASGVRSPNTRTARLTRA